MPKNSSASFQVIAEGLAACALAVLEAVSVGGVELLLGDVKADRSAHGAHARADRDDHVVGGARLAYAPQAHPQSGQARRGGRRVRPRKSDRGAVDGSRHPAGAQSPAGLSRPAQRLTRGRVARADADDGTDGPAGVIEDRLADRGADRPRCAPAGPWCQRPGSGARRTGRTRSSRCRSPALLMRFRCSSEGDRHPGSHGDAPTH